MKKSQKQKVVEQLEEFGYVSRNWALSQYCSRLGAIICDLKKEGYVFDSKNEGGDYRYYLKEIGKASEKTVSGQSECFILEPRSGTSPSPWR